MIEKKYDIKKKHGCWPDDYIKRAWEETQGMNKKESEDWATVIILQIVKRSLVQSDLKDKLVWNYKELHLTDTPDQMKAEKENVGPKADDGLRSTDRPTERSYQSNDVMETMGPTEGAQQHSGAIPINNGSHTQTGGVSQRRPETSFAGSNPSSHPCRVAPEVENAPRADETICIRIPFTEMFRSELIEEQEEVPNARSRYKLIDGAPSDADIRKRKSYVISFNNITRNARWVYEVLNKETLANNCVQGAFGDPYEGGHLAAAANHRWCQEALNDANLNSNITPQHKTLNKGLWKTLENGCRDRIGQPGVHNVHVYSGPLYRPILEQIDYRIEDKLVPTHFFKVIIVENDNGTVEKPKCYVMPNMQYATLGESSVDIEVFERDSELRFIERRPLVGQRDRIKKATLQGEGVNSTLLSVNIGVRISS
ncbi:hypothetical protein ABG768_020327 [Culter alburnus]|uniref:Endonuclease G, mitochondrial n=1 Tax=Culter alburnus TaxID=194366 RepID=A0AAW2AYH2_CULAL